MFIEQPSGFLRLFGLKALWLIKPEERAVYLTFDDGPIHPCSYEETDSYQVTSLFLNHREQLLKKLLEE